MKSRPKKKTLSKINNVSFFTWEWGEAALKCHLKNFVMVFQVYSFLISFWSNFFLWFWRTFSIQVCHKILTDFNHNICMNGMQNNNIVLSCLMFFFFFCWDLNFNLRQRWQECARELLRGWRIRKTLMQCWQHLTKLIWGLWELWFFVGSQALANLRAWLWLFLLRSYWPIVGLITVNNSKFLLTWQFSELLM